MRWCRIASETGFFLQHAADGTPFAKGDTLTFIRGACVRACMLGDIGNLFAWEVVYVHCVRRGPQVQDLRSPTPWDVIRAYFSRLHLQMAPPDGHC